MLNENARTLNRQQQTSAACQLSDTIGDNAVKWSLLKEGLYCTCTLGEFMILQKFELYKVQLTHGANQLYIHGKGPFTNDVATLNNQW